VRRDRGSVLLPFLRSAGRFAAILTNMLVEATVIANCLQRRVLLLDVEDLNFPMKTFGNGISDFCAL
jgi:hypothetical protein